jgi:restriction endonuclease S subunit
MATRLYFKTLYITGKNIAPKLRDMCPNVVNFSPEKFSLNDKFSDLFLENWEVVTKYFFLFLRLKF